MCPEVENTEITPESLVDLLLSAIIPHPVSNKEQFDLISQSVHHWPHEVIQETPIHSEKFQPNWPESVLIAIILCVFFVFVLGDVVHFCCKTQCYPRCIKCIGPSQWLFLHWFVLILIMMICLLIISWLFFNLLILIDQQFYCLKY